MIEYVVVFRIKEFNTDCIGMIAKDAEDKIVVEHPFYLQYSISSGQVSLIPYCVFSDEVYYEFKKSDLTFVVSCSDDIARKYVKMVVDMEEEKSTKSIDELEDKLDQLEATIKQKTYIKGPNTKH